MKRQHRPIACLAFLALALPAAADVIYSGFQEIGIPADYDGVFLNVVDGTWNVYPDPPPALPPEHHLSAGGPIAGVPGWGINPFYGGLVVANSPTFQPVRVNTGSMDAILNLGDGTWVGSGGGSEGGVFSTFLQQAGGENVGGPGYGISDGTHLGSGAGQFAALTEGYLGFRLNGVGASWEASPKNYGWMRVVFTNNSSGAVIRDWAYDDSNGSSIVVGRVRQDAPVGLTQKFNLYPDLGESFTLGSAIEDGVSGVDVIVNSVEKTGTGTVTLNTTNTYTGTTLVSGGTLLVNGTLGGTGAGIVTVESGATLGGDGSVTGAVTAEAGSFVAPSSLASSIGNLGLSSLDLSGALVIDWSSPTVFDVLNVSGNLILREGSTLTFNNLPGNLAFGGYVFATYGSVPMTGLTGTFGTTNLPEGLRIDYAYNGNQIALVPEPRAALLGVLGLLVLLLRRRMA